MDKKQEDIMVKPAETPVQALEPVARLRGEMGRLFDDFFAGFPSFGSRHEGFEEEPRKRFDSMLGRSMPAIDLADRGKAYRIRAELPGMDEKDIEVKLSSNVLTVRGEKKEDVEEKDEGYYLSERRFGSFSRSFRLPDDVDLDKIGARFEKGLLTIDLPKAEGTARTGRTIPVKKK